MTKTTIYDIAKAANCSAATVSLALNNSNRIKPETKQHILSIADQLNYVPNYVAKSLISSTTNSIGLIVPNVENPLFSMMISGIENYANNNGYNIILGLTEADEQREDFYLDMLQRRQVDGLILFPSFLDTLKEKLNRLNTLPHTPIVLCGSSGNRASDISYVKCDNRIGSYSAISHLISIGRRKIGCLFPAVTHAQFESRMTGYKDALYYHNIPFDEALIKICQPDTYSILNATKELLEQQNPDGIFCLYDYAAISVMRAILFTGRRIPEDVALIGYDNIQISNCLPIPLSTIDTHGYEVGQQAAKILIDKIINHDSLCQQIVLKPDLVVRDSTYQ